MLSSSRDPSSTHGGAPHDQTHGGSGALRMLWRMGFVASIMASIVATWVARKVYLKALEESGGNNASSSSPGFTASPADLSLLRPIANLVDLEGGAIDTDHED